MALARFERDFTDDAGNLLTGSVTVTVRRMSGGLPQLYSDRAGASALGNPFVNDGGRVAFHAEGNAYRVTVTQGAFSRELTYVAIGLAGESDFGVAQNQGDWSAVVTYDQNDYVVHDGVGIFISTQDSNLNHEPDDATPGSTAYWTYYPGIVGPAGPAGSGLDWQGAWVTATGYLVADGVEHDGSSYICLVAHTSGTFATDLAAAKWELFAAKGETGATGSAGSNGTNGTNGTDGADGADGTDPGVLLTWDDVNTDSDPGAGNLRADNDALGSATLLYVSKTNRAGDDISAFLAALDDSTNTIKGQVTLTRSSGNAQAGFNITGITDATGYVKVAVSGHWGATGFIDGNAISFQFSRAGNKGTDGAGAGDMIAATYDPQNIADDAFDRANHTGTQTATTISDFSTAADARVAAAVGVSVQAYDAELASWAGVTRASGVDTFVATPSSANLRSLLSDETGTGAAVFADSPALAGTPTVPTAAPGTNTTQAASTAFVIANAGGSLVDVQQPTTDQTAVTSTGFSGYRQLDVYFVFAHNNASAATYSLQGRVSGGTWRDMYTFSSAADATSWIGGGVTIANFNQAANKIVNSNTRSATSTLDASDANNTSTTVQFTGIAYVSWAEAWDEIRLSSSIASSIEGDTVDQRGLWYVRGYN